MEVLRVELEAPVCSFRLPHFLVGRQLTFDMPPPATIYGHVASAVGDFPDPRSFRFAYRFTTIGTGEDLENQHIIVPGGSRPFAIGGVAYPSSTSATVQPTGRQFLFGCRMMLYLDRLDFEEAFRTPRFTVILGRSQDLADYIKVEKVELLFGGTRVLRGHDSAGGFPPPHRPGHHRADAPLRWAASSSRCVLRALYCASRSRFRRRQQRNRSRQPPDASLRGRGRGASRRSRLTSMARRPPRARVSFVRLNT